MNDNTNQDDIDIDLIERYHRGLLDGADLQDFLKREKEDNDFAQKVRSYINVIEGIEYYGKQKDFADTIQEWEKEIKEHSRTGQKPHTGSTGEKASHVVPMHRKNLYWLAAAVVTLLVVSGVFLFRSATPDPTVLFQAYYEPYPNVFDPTVRGDADSLSVNAKGFRAYDQGNYVDAAKNFRQAANANDESERDIALLYLANSFLALDSATAAKNALMQIDEDGPVADQAKWYLALTWLKLGNLNEGIRILDDLADDSSSYRDKATQLLKDIDK